MNPAAAKFKLPRAKNTHIPGTKSTFKPKTQQQTKHQNFTFEGLEDYNIPIPALIKQRNPQKDNVVLLAVGVLVFIEIPASLPKTQPQEAETNADSIADMTDRFEDVRLHPPHHIDATGQDTQSQQTTRKLLLIRRAATDSMPLLWETPGGGCDSTDASVMHAAGRELTEESGLVAKRIVSTVGEPYFFSTRRNASSGKKIMKMNFVVEAVGTPEEVERSIRLDPKEHCEFLWADEKEVRDGVVADGTGREIWFTSKEQWDVCLMGFASEASRLNESVETTPHVLSGR